MSSITPHYRTVSQLLHTRSFSIDEYQREYKWDRTNIEELLSDLQGRFEASYQEGDRPPKASEFADYFLGSIIVTRRATKSYLVDGQQRVTSLTLLLIYLHRKASARDLPVAATLQPLIYSDDFGKMRFNLDVPERTPVIRALYNGEDYSPDGKDESVGTILARYQDIETYDLASGLGDGLETFIYWLLNKVGIIEIFAEVDREAYSIFETMNDRGKPLSPVDMLKAYLLSPIDVEESRAAANRDWKHAVLELTSWEPDPDPERDAACVKAWLRSQYADSIRDRKAGASDKDWELIGSTFHRWLRDNETRIGAGNGEHNLRLMTEEFPFFARAYRRILEASRTYTRGLETVFYNAHNDFTWQNTVLLAPLTVADDDKTVHDKMAATATYLDIWIMRRTVNYVRVGYSSVSYAMWLLCRDIRGRALPDLIDTLLDKLAHDDDASFDGSPSRNRRGISDLGVNQFSRRYIFHLLARLTAYTDVGAGKPDMFDKYVDRSLKNPYDIEHLWADRYHPYSDMFTDEQEFRDWRNHIAGLVLLPADVNRSLQDKPYAEKVPHYAKQNTYAASLTSAAYKNQPQFNAFRDREQLPFRPYAEFGRVEQQERRELVLALANRVWAPERLEKLRP